MTRVLCNAHFHLSRINTLEWDCCVTYVCILKGWQTAFQSGLTISLFHLYCGSIPLLHIPTVVLSVCILWIFHPNGCIVISSCDLEFTLVVMLNIFSMWVFIICVSSFGKNLFSRLAHLKKNILSFSYWWVLRVFKCVYSGQKKFAQYVLSKAFSSSTDRLFIVTGHVSQTEQF